MANKLFGSSGIRGIVGEKLTTEFCVDIGKSIGSLLPEGSNVCISTDARVTKDYIKNAVLIGILSTGVNLTDFGLLPTSILAFTTKHLKFDSGVMITASHNPPEFSGMKLWSSEGMGYSKNKEIEIEKLYESKKFRKVSWDKIGILTKRDDAVEGYFKVIKEKFPNIKSDLKILVDPGNGAMSGIASKLFNELGLNIITMSDKPNGMFPNRNPEPKRETLTKTIEKLNQENADIAICFDGDGDRVVFCDKRGFIEYNEAIGFVAKNIISNSKDKICITTVETGMLFDLAVKTESGTVKRCEVGDVFVARAAKEKNAKMGVEQCGHYIIPELGFYPDTIYPTLSLIKNIKSADEIREFFTKIKSLFYDKIGVECKDEEKYVIVDKISKLETKLKPLEINTLDGMRMEFSDGWILIRASGTQPLIRVNAEAETQERLKEFLCEGKRLINLIICKVQK